MVVGAAKPQPRRLQGWEENDGAASRAGHARVYAYNGSAWTQLGADIDGEGANDRFGRSISLNTAGEPK